MLQSFRLGCCVEMLTHVFNMVSYHDHKREHGVSVDLLFCGVGHVIWRGLRKKVIYIRYIM